MVSDNVHTGWVVEYLPRMLQIARTADLCSDRKGIPKVFLEGCEPALTTMEADLVVDRVGQGGVIYFHHNYLPHPVMGGVVNMVVREWKRVYGRSIVNLVPYQTEDRYCPSIIVGTVYAPNEAYMYGPRNNLYLQDVGGVVYEFPLTDMGTKLIPVIEELYLVTWNSL